MDPKSEGNNIKDRLCYSREFLLKYDKYTFDPDIMTLVTQLNNINNWSRSTPKKVIHRTPQESPLSDSKPSGRFPKTSLKKKNNVKFSEKNGTRTYPVKPQPRLVPPPGINLPNPLETDSIVLKANSFPSALNFNQELDYINETPRKIASFPLITPYTHLFPPNIQMPFDPNLESFGESKFTSLFSHPDSADISGEINLKPYLSLDFIDESPSPVPPKTPPSKPLLSPRSSETTEKSPFRNSKTPQKSPRNRPVSPLDDQRLIQRQKQIDYGYRTVGYLRYRLLVPKESRKPDHPRTPKKAQGCSKRSWDGQLKKWRRDLHLWDPDNLEAFRALLNSEVVETLVTANPELEDVVRSVREKLDNPNMKNDDEEEDSFEEIISYYNINNQNPIFKTGEENQVNISEPTKLKVARTLIF